MRQISLIRKLQREGGGHTLRRHRNGKRGGDDAATGRGDGREALDGVEDDDGWMGTRRRRGRGGDGGRHGLDGERGKAVGRHTLTRQAKVLDFDGEAEALVVGNPRPDSGGGERRP